MTIHTLKTAACIVAFCSSTTFALADGGTLRASQRLGDYRVSVFTSPAVLRPGPADISVLLQDAATGSMLIEPEIRLRMEHLDEQAIPMDEVATAAAATNKLFRAAQFDIPQDGEWRATVLVGPEERSLSFDLTVQPPLPAWLELAPWVGWPFGWVALFAVHRKFVARAAARNKAVSMTRAAGITVRG
jgi:hypothetical protein